jgi:dolichol-phosphate mannosyltransferase
VPTYNESANLGGLLTALRTAVPDAQVLVVDDASPDGTGELAAHRARSDEHLHVLHREGKTGLGQAYAAGFRAVLAAGATRVVQMDADGSHDPAAIPELLAAMDTHQADLVIGSRYVPGGSTPDWRWPGACSAAGGVPMPAPSSGSPSTTSPAATSSGAAPRSRPSSPRP